MMEVTRHGRNSMTAYLSARGSTGGIYHLRHPLTCHHQVVFEERYREKRDILNGSDLKGGYPEVSEVLTVYRTFQRLRTKRMEYPFSVPLYK
jgi:hypothetical protein